MFDVLSAVSVSAAFRQQRSRAPQVWMDGQAPHMVHRSDLPFCGVYTVVCEEGMARWVRHVVLSGRISAGRASDRSLGR